MSERVVCSECGQTIPSDARTLGLCPRCLLSRIAPVAVRSHRSALGMIFIPPDPAELQPQFEQLDILELIGQGGMGAVYKVRQHSLNRLAALKILPRDEEDDPAFAERFGREAHVLASLNHPNIVAAYEFGQTQDYWFLIMELIPGGNLRQVMNHGPMVPAAALRIIEQVCDALDHAHRHGVIHRDIKPENILLDYATPAAAGDPWSRVDAFFAAGGRVRVADFGLAKYLSAGSAGLSLTAPDHRLGTPYYMAPEQREGRAIIDGRTDVYSVGVMLYEMLTGRLPIGRFAPPSELAGVDPRLDSIIMTCLEPNPALRYPSAGQLRRHLLSLDTPPRVVTQVAILSGVALACVAALFVGGVVASRFLQKSTPTANAGAPPTPAVAQPGSARGSFGPPGFPTMEQRYQEMLALHGSLRTVTIYVDDLPSDVQSFVRDRLQVLSGCSNVLSSGSKDSLTIHLAPVSDLAALSRKIDFGWVRQIDTNNRILRIAADPARLPAPLPPPIADPRDPNFYKQNLADLHCWDRSRQRAALARLKKATPLQFRKDIATAIAQHLSDADAFMRSDAVDALVVWGGAETVDALMPLLRDPDVRVRRSAITGLAQLKDARAAVPIADMLVTDRAPAADALRAMGPAAEDAVLAQLRGSDMFVRIEAIRILKDIGTPRSLPTLETAARSEEGLVRMAADSAVEAIRLRSGAATGGGQ